MYFRKYKKTSVRPVRTRDMYISIHKNAEKVNLFRRLNSQILHGIFIHFVQKYLYNTIYGIFYMIYKLNRSHLSCYFSCKIFVLLFHTFTNFKTNYIFNNKSAVYRFKVCCNSLFSIFCFYICLI